MSKFLHTPQSPSSQPTTKVRSSSRVLTSRENMTLMEEREKKKRKVAELKEARKKACEEKKQTENFRRSSLRLTRELVSTLN